MCQKLLLFSFVLLVTVTCKDKDATVTPTIGDASFKTYIDRFVSEANARGVAVDVSKLSVVYSDTLNYYCGYGIHSALKILIGTRATCWAQENDMNREILMFHEMGHAILNRSHDNTKLPNGDYKTMMFGGDQFYLYSEYTPERRKYYLDELFDPSTPAPSWSSAKTVPTVVFSDTINAAQNIWRFVNASKSTETGSVTSEQYVSVGHSLKILSSSVVASTFSYWGYGMDPPQDLNQGDKLVLTVKIKLDKVAGSGGVYIAMVGIANSNNTFFNTTQGTVNISGTSNFAEYQVTCPYYVKASRMVVYLIFDNAATGTAYFDDIVLTRYQ